jgi:hypothetical protein
MLSPRVSASGGIGGTYLWRPITDLQPIADLQPITDLQPADHSIPRLHFGDLTVSALPVTSQF